MALAAKALEAVFYKNSKAPHAGLSFVNGGGAKGVNGVGYFYDSRQIFA